MAGPAVIGIAARIGNLGGFVGSLGVINNTLGVLTQSATAMAPGFKAASAGAKQFNEEMSPIRASITAVSTAFQTITAPVQAFVSGIGSIVSAVGALDSQVLGALTGVAAAGAALGGAGALGIGAFAGALGTAFGAAVGTAARFHQELVDLAAISGATAPQIASVEETVKRMASQFAIAIPDIQRTALELIKAGVSPDALANGVLRVALAFQQLSKGELSAEQAGQGLGSLLILFDRQFKESGQSVEDFSLRIGNAVTAVANNTRATIQEVINGVNILAPTLVARGQTLESVFTALNVVLSQGLRGEVAGTGLRNLFNFIINPSKEALKTINELNLADVSPFDVEGNLRPALDVLRSIQQIFGEDSPLNPEQRETASAQLFQTRAATIAAIIRNAGPEGLEQFAGVLEKTNILDQANSQLDTLIRQLGLVRNNAEVAAISFGQNFLPALTEVGKEINKFFTQNDFGKQGGAALGAGVLSLFTGTGQDLAFGGIGQNFGPEAATAFGDIFNQAQALQQPISTLVSDVGRLKDTIIGIAFPEGTSDAVSALGDALQTGVALADRFVNFLNSNLPTTAANFASLRDEAGLFLDKIVGIVTNNRGLDELPEIWESLQPLIDTARRILDETATNSAKFIRTLLDNRDPLITMLSTVLEIVNKVNQAMLGIAGNTVRFVGAIGGTANALGVLLGPRGFGQAANNLSGNFVTVTARERQEREEARRTAILTERDPTLGGGGLTPGQILGDRPALTGVDLEDRARDVDTFRSATELAAIAADEAARAEANQASAINTTTGARSNQEAANKAAEQALDAVKRANDRLTESLEDIDKSSRNSFRQLERALASIEQRYQDTMESIAEAVEDATGNLIENAERQRAELEESFDLRQREQTIRDQFQTIQEVNRRTFDRMIQDRQNARQIDRENADQEQSRFNEDFLRVFQQGEDRVSRARQRGIERSNTEFQRAQDQRVTSFTRAQEDIARRASEGFETQNLGIARGREDFIRQRDFDKELAKAKTDEERQSISERFREETTALTERRGFEDQDRQTRRSQEQQLLNLRRSQENNLVTFRQGLEDQSTNRRNTQAEDEVDYRIQLELRFIQAQRLIQDGERDRRRLADFRELVLRRQDEEAAFGFGKEQQGQQRQLDFGFAVEGLDRALQQSRDNQARGLEQILQQNSRRIASANRTAQREGLSAQLSFNDQVANGEERLADLRSDAMRSIQDQRAALLKEDPGAALPKTQEALAALNNAEGAITRAQAVLSASSILTQQRAAGQIDALQTRLGTIQTTADGALQGLLSGLAGLRAEGENPITITTVINSPQAERLATAMENLVLEIQKVKPGTNINELNITAPPADAAEVVSGLNPVGGSI